MARNFRLDDEAATELHNRLANQIVAQIVNKPIAAGGTISDVMRGGDGMTQFGRALHALNIDIICANSSPAKGRVERANKTLQDRLVKKLRLAGAATLVD